MKKLSLKWKSMAWYYFTHPSEFNKLVQQVKTFASKDGLRQVKDDFNDMYCYVKDVSTGKYKGFNLTNLILVLSALVYLVTPADMIPDFLPGAGLVDDVSILAWAAKQVVDELEKYKKYIASSSSDTASEMEELLPLR